MKNIIASYKIMIALVASILLTRCDKTPENPIFEPYAETNLDTEAGTWKTYVLTGGGDIAVPAPESPASAAYRAELGALKSVMSAATAEQRELARQWGENGVLRWHEIARELAAQYNVPPNNNPDGTYPAPDPNNPTVYPRFPFANPPYASRAFALLAVAQYDALVAAWQAKFKYNRPAPSKIDAGLQPLIPVSDLPAYPSEDAVVAAASRALLTFLFPGEKAKIAEFAETHKNSRLWAGANVPGDLAAGDSLGAKVAERIIAYARTDRMGQANNQAGVPTLRAAAAARGLDEAQQWKSLDLPVRAPMLPFFGNVKTWNLNQEMLVSLRPAAPPAPGSPEFEANLAELRKISKKRTREQFRIAAFWADGAGTYTPPGHWNRKGAELMRERQFSEIRAARGMALLNTAIQDAGIACWEVKYYYLLPRPTQVDPSITTSTGIPNFPAYTSGHSTFSAAAAEVLGYLFPERAGELQAMAKEASESRILGCIHYRFDCEIGLQHGQKIGNFAVQRGRADGSK
jgi:membrane-associated phospholipid phosphatase